MTLKIFKHTLNLGKTRRNITVNRVKTKKVPGKTKKARKKRAKMSFLLLLFLENKPLLSTLNTFVVMLKNVKELVGQMRSV